MSIIKKKNPTDFPLLVKSFGELQYFKWRLFNSLTYFQLNYFEIAKDMFKFTALNYMAHLWLLSIDEKYTPDMETQIHAFRIYRQDIGMEFGIEKCAMLVMKSGKRHLTDGIEIPNKDKIRTLGEKETYKYLGNLEADTVNDLRHSLFHFLNCLITTASELRE